MMPVLLALLLAVVPACEGPVGPQGPPGPQGSPGTHGEKGERGEKGESAAQAVIEHTFDSDTDGWDEEWKSYTFFDSQFQPETGHLLQVWVKQFYTNTGDPYYMDFSDWKGDSEYPIYQVREGAIRFFDPWRELEGQTVLVVISS